MEQFVVVIGQMLYDAIIEFSNYWRITRMHTEIQESTLLLIRSNLLPVIKATHAVFNRYSPETPNYLRISSRDSFRFGIAEIS